MRVLLELASLLASLVLAAGALALLVVLPRAVHRRTGSTGWTLFALAAAVALTLVGALAVVLVGLAIGGGS